MVTDVRPDSASPNEVARALRTERSAGSVEDFEKDWAEALATRHPRWFAFPDPARGDQIGLIEWVKACQMLQALHAREIRGGKVLEYGCGSAGISVFLKEHGFDVYVADLSANALEVARINDEAHRSVPRSLHRLRADALALPMADATFDVVLSNGLLEHFEEEPLKALLKEVTRVLRPGGVFLADIVPAGFNVRALATVLNFCASFLYHVLRGRFAAARQLRRRYFDHHFESAFGPAFWAATLAAAGLGDVRVQVCRPFPLLAIEGRLERLYVRILRALLPLWRAFDNSTAGWTRYWGWMYLVVGTRRA